MATVGALVAENNSEILGKVVAITGASSGIGEATAMLLAARGAKVLLGARRADRLDELTRRIVEAVGDVRRRDDLEVLVTAAQ